MGLQGIIRGKPIRTTISDKAAPCPLDRVNRQFFAPAPNMLWLSDFTYVATWQGFVYVAFVIDALHAALSVGGQAGSPMRASSSMPWIRRFMIGGPSIAVGSSTIPTGCAIRVIRYSERLAEAGIEPSVGSVGDSYDNALAETINGLTRQRSFIGEDHGATSKLWSSPHSNGSIGSTTAVFWSP